ncbi:MAG TPA: hypothetical protein VFI31_06455 [Pirellulales bacterium]|nr:hypothetical protein [Pirellulales bacterium]
MFFAITALGVSAVQILIGVAIGMSLRKNRQRQEVVERPLRAREPRQEGVDRPVEGPAEIRPQPDHRQPASAPQLAHTDVERRPHSVVPQPAPTETSEGRLGSERAVAAFPRATVRPQAEEPIAAPSGKDRRISSRRAFEFRQRVAPYHGGLLPGKASFREVECQDISSTGFSFLSSQLPDFDSIVVALGAAPELVYLQAQIVNRFEVADGPAPLYRIGCRFVGQVTA